MSTLIIPVLTNTELNEIAKAATEAYFEALLDQGRVFDHAELSLMINLAIEGEETRRFVAANR